MQVSELSMLIPVKNMENEIPRILSFAAKQAEGIPVEFVIVDMGSVDRTVLQAVLLIKKLGLHGFVIQNGDSAVPAALNTAVQKAGSEYLTFLSARRLYTNFLPQYLDTAKRSHADLIFGCATKDEVRAAERRAISSAIRQPSGVHFVKDAFRRKAGPDLAAILVRREFLRSKQVDFDENCAYGYAEEFVLQSMLTADTVAQSPVLLRHEQIGEFKKGKQSVAGLKIFQKVEAVLRVLDTAKSSCGNDTELLRLLEKERIPRTVMDAVDVMLREGSSYRAVRSFLDLSGYDRLLSVDRKTDSDLKRSILIWKTVPWLYRPQHEK